MEDTAGQPLSRHTHCLAGVDVVWDNEDWGVGCLAGPDPGLVDAVETDSWLLDMDAFNSRQISFEANQLTAISEQLSERVYTFFRWMITEDGILHFEQAQ
jgi:uncharacterized protein (TIGR04255 family)